MSVLVSAKLGSSLPDSAESTAIGLSKAAKNKARRDRPRSTILEFSGHSPRSVAILFDYADEFEDAQGHEESGTKLLQNL